MDSREISSAVGTQFLSKAGRQAVVSVGSVNFAVIIGKKRLGSQQKNRDGRVIPTKLLGGLNDLYAQGHPPSFGRVICDCLAAVSTVACNAL